MRPFACTLPSDLRHAARCHVADQVLAGQEPAHTNAFLQMLGAAALKAGKPPMVL